FFFNTTATTEIYTLSLHDALPIWRRRDERCGEGAVPRESRREDLSVRVAGRVAAHDEDDTHDRERDDERAGGDGHVQPPRLVQRSEEHTSELQSRSDLVCRLLLEK